MSDYIWLYGKHTALAALQNRNRRCRQIVIRASMQPYLPKLPHLPTAKIVHPAYFAKILPKNAAHQNIAVQVSPLPPPALASLTQAKLLLLLDHITDPHNTGAILRSAAAFGVAAVITTKRHQAGDIGVIGKTACGMLEQVALLSVTNLSRTLQQLKHAGFFCLALDGKATHKLHDYTPTAKQALIIGAEGKGIRPLVKRHADLTLNIPIHPSAQSLNASNAAAIALHYLANTPV